MDRDDDLIARWSELLTVDSSTPPPPLVARCAAVFGAAPDLVLCQQIQDHGTRWRVAVVTAALFGCAEAHSSHPSWDSGAYVQQLGHDDGATYDCWAVPLREVVRVGTLPVEDDGRHWRPVDAEHGRSILSSWRVELRDGTHVDLPAGELPTALEAHDKAEEIAVSLLKSLSV
jgi:hypothetical protein